MHREERTMTTIYLIRHAEAEGNVFRRIHGQYDSCVTPNGRRQIAALAQRFAGIPVDAVYASDLKRTCLTATAIYRQKGLPLHRDARFREVGLGPWEDTPFGELERRYPAQLHAFSHDSYHWYVEGAECFLQYAHRFLAGLDDVVRRHEGQSIAIFSHGMVLRGALIELFFPGQDEGVSHSENTAVTELHWENGSYELISLNDATHLTPELSTLGRQTWWRGSGSGVEDLRYEPLRFPRDEAFYLQCYRDAWRNVHETDEGFVPELYARSAARHAQEHPGSVVRVLSGDRVVGLVELDPGRDEQSGCGWISLLYMLPEYRGRGWAIQLLGYAFWFYENHDRAAVRLHVSENNARAITFYQRSGFVQIGRDPGVRAHLLLMGRLIHRTVTHGTV